MPLPAIVVEIGVRRYCWSPDSLNSSQTAGANLMNIIIVWDPEIITEDEYADLITAIGNIIRASGGEGIKRIKSKSLIIKSD